MNVLYELNTNVLELVGLYDQIAGTYINTATVTVTLKDAAGVNITGMSWPAAMAYVSASNGDYRVTLPATIGITPATIVTAFIDADDGVDRDAHWEVQTQIKERTQW